jgi:hypothetical protein
MKKSSASSDGYKNIQLDERPTRELQMLEIKCEGSASFDISFAHVIMKHACWDAEPLPDNDLEKTIIYECNSILWL